MLAAIARKLEMTPQNLNKLLKAKEVKLSTLERIAAAIDKPVSFFLGDEAPATHPKVTVYPGSNMERILRNANEQAGEPIFDYEIINPEVAVRQLLKQTFEQHLKIEELERERDEWKDRYIKLLEEVAAKKENDKCG